MMKIKLPLMTMSTDLDGALANLRQSKRAALISEQGGTYHLFSAGSIVVGRSRGIKTLAELKVDPRSSPPPTVMPLIAKSKTKQIFSSQRDRLPSGRTGKRKTTKATSDDIVGRSGNYVLGRIVGKNAFIGLLDTDLVDKYVSSPSDCYCDGPRHHDSFTVVVRDGDQCPYKDGHKIVCAR